MRRTKQRQLQDRRTERQRWRRVAHAETETACDVQPTATVGAATVGAATVEPAAAPRPAALLHARAA